MSGGYSYVVIAGGGVTTRFGQEPNTVWYIMPLEDLQKAEIPVYARQRVWADEEVDSFFPGVAYLLPDYIK